MKYALNFILVLIVFFSAVQVVISQHEARRLFVEIQTLEKTRDNLNEEWTRLLLEQSTWATDARIETVARSELNMKTPDGDSVLLIEQ